MKVSDVDHAAIKPFLNYSYPSFRLRSDGSYTILGLIDGQQFIVEGVITGRTPKAGLYCADSARQKEFKPSTATPAPPEAHASHKPREVDDLAVFQLWDSHDGNPSIKELKKLFRVAYGPDVLLTPHDPNKSNQIESLPSIVVGPYGDIELNVKSEGASGDTYMLSQNIICVLPSHDFECSITEEDIMILESQVDGYYFLTSLEKADLSKNNVMTKSAAIEQLASEILKV